MQTMPEIVKERDLYLSNSIDANAVNGVVKDIQKIVLADNALREWFNAELKQEYTPEPIRLFIDSSGGKVYHTLGLYDVIRSCRTPVHTIALGLAASCAGVLLVAGHKRFAYANSTILLHSVSAMLAGKSEELKDDVEETLRLNEIINGIFIERTQVTAEQLHEKDKYKKDWWIPAREALSLGIIDGIIGEGNSTT